MFVIWSANQNFIIFVIQFYIFFSFALNETENNEPQFQLKPQWLTMCSREDPNKDNCFKTMFENMFPYLAHGIPEVGIEHFEPLHISMITVSRGSGNLKLIGGFRNLVIRGPSNATVKRASLDLKKQTLDFDLVLPILKIDALYNLKGNILLLPLSGNGDVIISLKDVRTSVKTKITVQNRPAEVIHIESMKVTFLVGNLRIHLENLFGGNKVLGESLNMFLNQNANEVISELREDLESGLEGIFTKIWNNVFTKIPLKYWLI